MFILRDSIKEKYLSMIHADVALDQSKRNVPAYPMDRETKKIYQHALSLPFWTVLDVLDHEQFQQIVDFQCAFDIVVAPESCWNKFCALYGQRKIV